MSSPSELMVVQGGAILPALQLRSQRLMKIGSMEHLTSSSSVHAAALINTI